jgi:hypothetical protein
VRGLLLRAEIRVVFSDKPFFVTGSK